MIPGGWLCLHLIFSFPSLLVAETKTSGFVNLKEIPPSFWENLARDRLKQTEKIFKLGSLKRAKNVILFLGDGMGLPTISAARFYKAEVRDWLGESSPSLYFEKWPFHTLCRTYDLSTVVTDSASAATAYLGGTKTRTGLIGLTGDVEYRSCRPFKATERVESVLEAAIKAGLATGIVTTSRVTHASPAGAFAHIASRYWEGDRMLKEECGDSSKLLKDISRQLVEDHLDINVVLGGGAQNFFPVNGLGDRRDGRNLGEQWLLDQKSLGRRATLITDVQKFMQNDFDEVDYLLGLLSKSHMPYDAERHQDEPSLANLTTTAIKILSRQKKGFFLFVEGGRIDHAHHHNHAKLALLDTLAFEEAIRVGTQMVNLDETLVIVTADHSHSLSLIGEPSRNQSLLENEKAFSNLTMDRKGLIPLVYSTGPGAAVNTTRRNLSDPAIIIQFRDLDFQQPALIPLPWATHGGEDVGVYATGLFSHLFHSTVDNTFVAQAMKYAMCLEPFLDAPHCFTPCTGPIMFFQLLLCCIVCLLK